MTWFTLTWALVFLVVASTIISECTSARVISPPVVHALAPVTKKENLCWAAFTEILHSETTAIQAALDLKTLARLTADNVKTDALNVTLTAAIGAQLAVFLGKPGDIALDAVLKGAIVAYNAIFVPAEAAHVISYNAADSACLISITAAIAAYTIAVNALGPCAQYG